jgi:hypothetical protein
MNSPVKVNAVWSEEKMARLPSGTSYATVAKFAEDANNWPSEGWSVVLDFPPGSAQVRSFEATARFLMSNAPWDRLKAGCVFELYEGTKRTATVTVM